MQLIWMIHGFSVNEIASPQPLFLKILKSPGVFLGILNIWGHLMHMFPAAIKQTLLFPFCSFSIHLLLVVISFLKIFLKQSAEALCSVSKLKISGISLTERKEMSFIQAWDTMMLAVSYIQRNWFQPEKRSTSATVLSIIKDETMEKMKKLQFANSWDDHW